MQLRFVLAVNNENNLEKMHFGDADRFLIYSLEDDTMKLSSEEINHFQFMDKDNEQGSRQKCLAILNFLKKQNVHVLVSEHFCPNINLLNEFFIPVVVNRKSQDEIIAILHKHLHWILDEWENNTSGFSLFTIHSGILKTSLDNKNTQEKASV